MTRGGNRYSLRLLAGSKLSSHGGQLISMDRPESRFLILQLLNSCNS